MKTITLHPKATAALLQGLLVVNSLISGTSALQCYSSSSIMRCSPGGTVTLGLSAPASITTCSSEENVCVEAQLKLRRENEILLVNYRGCGRKNLRDGTKPTVTSDGTLFPFQSDSRCCDSDLCNGETGSQNDPKTPGNDKGPFSNSLSFKSCQHSSSGISQDQTLHPITVISQWDSCCTNSFGNVLGTAGQTLKNGSRDHINASYTESSANYSTVPSKPELHPRGKGPGHYNVTIVDLNDTDLLYDDYGAENDTVYLGTPDSTLRPRLRESSANGLILQLFPLLITTGISVLGIWW